LERHLGKIPPTDETQRGSGHRTAEAEPDRVALLTDLDDKRQTRLAARVYETMPTPGYDYQTWMVAEVQAIQKAVVHKVSTERLSTAT
jgi:hypothetical protein